MRKQLMRTGMVLFLLTLMLVETSEPGVVDEIKHDKTVHGEITDTVLSSKEPFDEGQVVYSPTSKEAFLAKITQETSEPVCDIFYEDYEGNGEYSAFVFTGTKEKEGEGTGFLGSLWYVNREGCKLLKEKIETSGYTPTILTWGNEKHLLFAETGAWGIAHSYFWRIQNNTPLQVENLPHYTYQQGEDVIVVNSFSSHQVEGRIWQRYYIYWDDKEQCYQEYIGEKISEEEFLAYENALQLQQEIEKDFLEANFKKESIDGIHREYMLRENGVINIQFQFEQGEAAYYYYAILRKEEGNKVIKDEYFSYDVYEQGYIQEQGIWDLMSRPKKEEEEGRLEMVKEHGSYQIYHGSQLKELARMIANDEEIEPGLPAARASYFLCNDVVVEDWLRLGSAAYPFQGELTGYGAAIIGVDFAIKSKDEGLVEGINIQDRREGFRPWEELEDGQAGEIEEVFGSQAEEVLEQILANGNSSLGKVRIQRTEELDSCIFTLKDPEGKEGSQYYLFLQGKWQGKKVDFTHMGFETASDWPDYLLTVMDINFDGRDDLLIYEGYSGREIGWKDCHGILWNAGEGRFEDFPSFPRQVSWMELAEEEVLWIGRSRDGSKRVRVFGLWGGEYLAKEELIYEIEEEEADQGEKKEKIILSYYQQGELIHRHDITESGGNWEELYPHLNYWRILVL